MSRSTPPRHDDEIKLMKGQSTKDREKLRIKQRELGERINGNKEAIGDVNSSTFQEMRAANNALERKVAFMRESVLDVQNLRAITQATTKQAAHLAIANQAVSVEKLIASLRRKGLKGEGGSDGGLAVVEDGDFDWAKLGTAVGAFFATPPPVEWLCGPVGKPPPEKKERKRKERTTEGDEAEEQRPEDVKGDEGEEVVESTQKRLKLFPKSLAKHQRKAAAVAKAATGDASAEGEVDFFGLVVNPQSFTQTVENIFDLSFMVKQGSASLALDAAGLPVVQAMRQGDTAQDHADQKSSQLVMAFSMADQRRAAEIFKIMGPGVPHRNDATYEEGYEGVFVGKRDRAPAPASSLSSKAPVMSKPKGKGRAKK